MKYSKIEFVNGVLTIETENDCEFYILGEEEEEE